MSVSRRSRQLNPGWEQRAHRFPFRCDAPEGSIPLISRAIKPCITTVLKDGTTRRWAFTKRSHRDQFVGVWRHVGAHNA